MGMQILFNIGWFFVFWAVWFAGGFVMVCAVEFFTSGFRWTTVRGNLVSKDIEGVVMVLFVGSFVLAVISIAATLGVFK